jgi:hypothetical protein
MQFISYEHPLSLKTSFEIELGSLDFNTYEEIKKERSLERERERENNKKYLNETRVCLNVYEK